MIEYEHVGVPRPAPGSHYEAVPLVPSHRRSRANRPLEECAWFTAPCDFAADLDVARQTDVLNTPTGWTIVSTALADALDDCGPPLKRKAIRLVDTEMASLRARLGGRTSDDFVALFVPDVVEWVDYTRTRARFGRLLTLPAVSRPVLEASKLPGLFRYGRPDRIYGSLAAEDVLGKARGLREVGRVQVVEAERGRTSLMELVRTGTTPLAAGLLSGAALEARDDYGWSPLFHATEVGNEAAVRELIAAGADIEARSRREMTSLMLAGFHGQLGVAEALVSAGAERSSADRAGWTAAHWAAFGDQSEMCRRVLAPSSTAENSSPLRVAVERNHPRVVEVLIESRSHSTADLTELLETALKRRWSEIALHLLRGGANVTNVNQASAQPMHNAAKSGNRDLVDAMLDAGLSVDMIGSSRTALASLADSISDDAESVRPMMKYLLSLGANPTVSVAPDKTALDFARRALQDAQTDPFASEQGIAALEQNLELLLGRVRS